MLGKNYLVTFQERPGDCFDLIRAGIRHEQSAMRQGTQADYLAYRLIDAAIDAYFPVLEGIGDHLDQLDDQVAAAESRACVCRAAYGETRAAHAAAGRVAAARCHQRAPPRDHAVYFTDTRVYLRDCYDHAVQLIDLLESYRDIAGDVRDFYLSSITNRMNEVMKTLTVIATIFLPLSFIAGVYGMNFNTEASPWNMPELNWRYGYPFALALMAAVAVGMLLYFQTPRLAARRSEPSTMSTNKSTRSRACQPDNPMRSSSAGKPDLQHAG